MASQKFIVILIVLPCLFLSSGCAVNRATAKVDPKADLSIIKSLTVLKDKDERGVSLLIENKLKSMGFQIVPEETSQSGVDAIVTYRDYWMWDITTYMLELTITIKDPKTDFTMASGNSYHTSLTRKSPEEMVDEVINNIFMKGK
jgi:hypothetical protein